ncbi:helix-turn-helix domain-containing protein [Aeromonas jandaei]|uniref:helix-turn-helix domain-containing protein n=1 Tax=Aeromonas jandaei TaxID=650 RepID=UPI003EC6AA32
MVNPLWLHTLVVVHETGSFTRAADRLDLTQAAVSQHISRLEANSAPCCCASPVCWSSPRAAGAARLCPPAGAGRRTAASPSL